MNDMQLFPGVSADRDLTKLYKESKVALNLKPDTGLVFLRFNGDSGQYFAGAAKEDMTNSELLVNPFSFKHGWALWEAGKINKRMVAFTDSLPDPQEPIKTVTKDGDPVTIRPSEARAFRLLDLATQTQYELSTNSHGGRQGCDVLFNEVSSRIEAGEQEYLFPFVELSAGDMYQHDRGKSCNMSLKIKGWYDFEGNLQGEPKTVAVESSVDDSRPVAAPANKTIRERRPVASS